MTKSGERLRQLIEFLNVTESQFAKNVGIAHSNLKKYLHTDFGIGKKFASSIVEYYKDVNALWLINGQGEMIIKNPTTALGDKESTPEGEQGNRKPLKQDDMQLHVSNALSQIRGKLSLMVKQKKKTSSTSLKSC